MEWLFFGLLNYKKRSHIVKLLTLEFNDVFALFSKEAWSDRSMGTAIDCKISTHFDENCSNESEMAVGWNPFIKSFCEASSKAPEINFKYIK